MDNALHQALRCRGTSRQAHRRHAFEPFVTNVLGAIDQVETAGDGVTLVCGEARLRLQCLSDAVVRLRLAPTYVYGDTTSVLTYELRRMSADWSFPGASPDTTLSVGDQIFSFSFNASDTLVDVVLPSAWVAENDALLRGTTFASDFHGFQIAPVSGNAVVGFDRRDVAV